VVLFGHPMMMGRRTACLGARRSGSAEFELQALRLSLNLSRKEYFVGSEDSKCPFELLIMKLETVLSFLTLLDADGQARATLVAEELSSPSGGISIFEENDR
jgi:hypothetical protein